MSLSSGEGASVFFEDWREGQLQIEYAVSLSQLTLISLGVFCRWYIVYYAADYGQFISHDHLQYLAAIKTCRVLWATYQY